MIEVEIGEKTQASAQQTDGLKKIKEDAESHNTISKFQHVIEKASLTNMLICQNMDEILVNGY